MSKISDLTKFNNLFDCKFSKIIPEGLEVRVTNLEYGKYDAAKLIRTHKLNLEVTNHGSMHMIRSFLVRERSVNDN